MTSVKVAVRCRPFNSREKALNAKLIIRMESGNTYITNPVSNPIRLALTLLFLGDEIRKYPVRIRLQLLVA